MSIHIGAGPIGWYEDDFAPFNNDIVREAHLIALARAGFDGLELGPHSRRDILCVRAALVRHALAFLPHTHAINLQTSSVEAEFARLAEHVAAARALGADVLTVAEMTGAIHTDRGMPLTKRPKLDIRQWIGFGTKLSGLAGLVKAAGLKLAYRPHMGTIVESGNDIERLIAVTSADVGFLLDTGHLAWGGTRPAAFAKAHAERIVMIHLTDIDGERAAAAIGQRQSYLEAVDHGVFVSPGTGSAEVEAVIAALPEFDGWIVIDSDRGGTPAQIARLRGVATSSKAA
ncbi:MAG: sugar phosphate isomerase/epimerase [Ancalomicrobiaceae bacterium]|nr:sugar phosphate isomerase/epimerase [Ancalomicrobiaceae bacterium]